MMFLIILNLKDIDTPHGKQRIFVDPMQHFAIINAVWDKAVPVEKSHWAWLFVTF